MQVPHTHSEIPEDKTLDGLDQNYCINPTGNRATIWCYTTDPAMKWDFCYPINDEPEFQRKEELDSETMTGINKDKWYRGSQHKTQSGQLCQRWNS